MLCCFSRSRAVFQVEVFNALQMWFGSSKYTSLKTTLQNATPNWKWRCHLKSSIEYAHQALFIRKLINQISSVLEERRHESQESLPLLPCYHLHPWTCNFLDFWMLLASGSPICFISITTPQHWEIPQINLFWFPFRHTKLVASDPIYFTLIGDRRASKQEGGGGWITTSLNAWLLMQGLKSGTRSKCFQIQGYPAWGGI